MRWLITIFCLLFATGLQAQSYTVTENNCRVYFSNALDREAFWVDQLLWRHVGSNPDQLQIFDGISAITVQDANLVNYPTTDSLITQLEAWVVECDTAGQVVPVPGPEALFANSKSIDLDGSAEYVSVADAPDLSMIEGGSDIPFTISMWVNWEASGSDTWLAKWDNVNGEYQILTGGPNDIIFNVFTDGSNYLGARTNVAFAQNKYQHLAISYNGNGAYTDISIYYDGVLQSTTSTNIGTYTGMSNTAVNLAVGSRSNGTALFTGKMDQVCIFRNVELSLEEIKELMTIRDVTQFTYYDSLVLYQEYDNDTTGTDGITDLSPAGNNGTMQAGEYADLQECITWPYDYQLDTTDNWANLTPMQSAADTSFGGFGMQYNRVEPEYIDFGNVLDLDETDSFSIVGWIRYQPTNAQLNYIIGKQLNAGNFTGWQLYIDASNLLTWNMLNDNSPANRLKITADAAFIEDQWQHVGITYNGSQDSSGIRMYINGALADYTVNDNSLSASIANANDLRIAVNSSGQAITGWEGRIADIAIAHRYYSAAEINAMYNNHEPVDMRTLGDSLIAYWPFLYGTTGTSTILDQSGNGYDGTTINSDAADIEYTTPREIFDADTAGSFDFDGSADYVNIPDAAELSQGGGDVPCTISWWIIKTGSGWQAYIAKGDSDTNIEWDIRAASGSNQLRVRFCDGDINNVITNRTGDNALSTTNWNHVVVTYDGSALNTGIKIYINGIRSDISPNSAGTYTQMDDTNAPLWIGRSYQYYGPNPTSHVTFIKGIALTQCEVQELYNDGSPIDPSNATFSSDWTNASHWKLDQSDDGNGTVTDQISTNDGTSINSVATSSISYPTN